MSDTTHGHEVTIARLRAMCDASDKEIERVNAELLAARRRLVDQRAEIERLKARNEAVESLLMEAARDGFGTSEWWIRLWTVLDA